MSQADKYLFANTSKISTQSNRDLSRRGNDAQKVSKSNNQSPINMSRKTSITPTKSRETSPFSNKFYNRIYEKDEKDKMREQIRMKEIQELSQTKKMSQNSYRILCKQLEEKLALEIQKLDMQETKMLTFEQLGRLLTVFKVIETIQYNESCEYNQNIFYSQDQYLISKRDEEMEFHEQIWMILSNYEKGSERISADFTFAILRLLFDPAQLNIQSQQTLFTHYINKQFPNSNAKKSQFIKDLDQNSYMPWNIQQLINKYRKLSVTKISKVQLAQFKEKQVLDIQNSTQFPFQPQINDKSRILDELNRSKLHVDHLLFSKDESDKQGSNSTRQATPDRITVMNQKNEMKLNKIKQLQETIKQNELKQCSFHPQTNHNSVNASRTLSKSPNRSQSQKSFQTDQSDRVFERLYSQRVILPDKHELEKKRIEEDQQKEQEILQQCTFQPKLTPYSPSRSKSPNGFDKSVGRLRMGHQKHVEHQQKLEHKPVGEGYEKKQKQKFNPPDMLNRTETKYKPFIVLDINIKAGKSGRIGICEGDNPITLAKNFSKAYDLDQDMEETVLDIIQQQIQQYYNKKQLKSVKSSTQLQTGNQQQMYQNKSALNKYYNQESEAGGNEFSYQSQSHQSYATYY